MIDEVYKQSEPKCKTREKISESKAVDYLGLLAKIQDPNNNTDLYEEICLMAENGQLDYEICPELFINMFSVDNYYIKFLSICFRSNLFSMMNVPLDFLFQKCIESLDMRNCDYKDMVTIVWEFIKEQPEVLLKLDPIITEGLVLSLIRVLKIEKVLDCAYNSLIILFSTFNIPDCVLYEFWMLINETNDDIPDYLLTYDSIVMLLDLYQEFSLSIIIHDSFFSSLIEKMLSSHEEIQFRLFHIIKVIVSLQPNYISLLNQDFLVLEMNSDWFPNTQIKFCEMIHSIMSAYRKNKNSINESSKRFLEDFAIRIASYLPENTENSPYNIRESATMVICDFILFGESSILFSFLCGRESIFDYMLECITSQSEILVGSIIKSVINLLEFGDHLAKNMSTNNVYFQKTQNPEFDEMINSIDTSMNLDPLIMALKNQIGRLSNFYSIDESNSIELSI